MEHPHRWRIVLLPWLLLSCVLLACSHEAAAKPPATLAAATATPGAAELRKSAEARYVSQMSEPLATLIRAQPWYDAMTPDGLELAKAILACERDAKGRGEGASVKAMLDFAAGAGWYQDGLDHRETRALTGVYLAYSQSLKDDYAPPIGSVLATTLRFGLFDVLQLPETGEFIILVSAQTEAEGRTALNLAGELIPGVEGLVGAYQYNFLHIEVTPELPPGVAGLSYNQFIEIHSDYNDAATIAHELTHSTMYGIFPMWFEEGLAYFNEFFLTSTPAEGQAMFENELRLFKRAATIDVKAYSSYADIRGFVEQAAGFLFLKSLVDLQGPDAFFQTVRTLRTKSYNDQELVRSLVQDGPADLAAARAALVCQRIVGLNHNYCIQ